MTEEILEKLAKYGRTVISPSRFKKFDCDTQKVVEFLESKGFKKCKCWISINCLPSLTSKECEQTIIIEGVKENDYH